MSRTWTRRDLLDLALGCGVVTAGSCALARLGPLFSGNLVQDALAGGALDDLLHAAPEARYWISTATAREAADCMACHPGGAPREVAEHRAPVLKCLLCAQGCVIGEGERGQCRARMNLGGRLRSLVYGRPVSIHVDPIEKKPFYHFLPGSTAFSLCTSGCPLRCRFCQNWQISQSKPEDYSPPFRSPDSIVAEADESRAPVVAFTYNEATVYVEYMVDIARLAREAGLRTALVSCGFMNEAPLAEMCEHLDAIKIDLKGFSEDFYRTVCNAHLDPVLRSIRQIARSGVHLEIVNLVVPSLNDQPDQLRGLCEWVVGEVGPDVPIHFTRFHPDYQLPNLPPTPVATLDAAWSTARAQGIRYAYVGNVPGHPGNNTSCPGCGQLLIERSGFFVTENVMVDGKCPTCGAGVAGVWS